MNKILPILSLAFIIPASLNITYQVYKMTVIDAKARNLKHPKLWGLFTAGGNNSSGLILYLIGRKRYPSEKLDRKDRNEMNRRKKVVGISLLFVVLGTLPLLFWIFYYHGM